MASYRTAPWFQGVLLGGFALVATAALAFGHRAAAPDIEMRLKEDLAASLEQVIPAKLRDNDMAADTVSVPGADGKPVTVYRARKNSQVSAVAYRVVGSGYGGDIVLVMGVDRTGEILGVRVVSHSETPGLGDKIDPRKTSWLDAFKSLSLANTAAAKWAVKKDGGSFDQFSGATITPRAVVKAVHEGLAVFGDNRGRLLGEPTARGDGSTTGEAPEPKRDTTPRRVS